MGLFKKKTDYSYYSSYSSSRRRLKVGRTVIAVIAAVVVILGIIIYFNFNRIQFLMKGYSWSTTSELVSSFDNDEEKELLSHDEMKHILKWIDNSNKVALYDEYEQFYSLHKDMNYEDIVDVVNYIFENQVPSLKSMGYSEKTIWSMLKDGAILRLYLFTLRHSQKQIVFQILLYIQIINPFSCFNGFRV